MSNLTEGASMVLISWVVVGSGSRASFCKISELMDMNTMFCVRVKAFDSAGNVSRSANVLLAKGYDSSNVGVMGIKNANCMPFCIRNVLSLIQEKRSKASSSH